MSKALYYSKKATISNSNIQTNVIKMIQTPSPIPDPIRLWMISKSEYQLFNSPESHETVLMLTFLEAGKVDQEEAGRQVQHPEAASRGWPSVDLWREVDTWLTKIRLSRNSRNFDCLGTFNRRRLESYCKFVQRQRMPMPNQTRSCSTCGVVRAAP